MIEMQKIYKNLGQRIRSIRKKKGLTLEELCFEINMDYSFLARIETGNAVASLESLYRIAKGLGVNFLQLFNDTEIKEENLIDNEITNITKKLSAKEKKRILSIVKLSLKK